jgi:hypothetical protein
MQVSALNLIIAAQQARTAPTPAHTVEAKSKPPVEGAPAEFAPLAFKTLPAETTCAPNTPTGYSPTAPLGSQVDIRI